MRGVTLALRWTARVLFALLCVAVAAYAFAYLFRDHPPGNRFHQQFMASGWDVPMHFFGGGVALLLAPLQLGTGLRRIVPRLHRLSGGVYIGAVLIGGLGALSMARHSQGPTGLPFAMLATLWLLVTALGLRHAIAGRIDLHRRWMARSIALTASAVTLRLILGAGLAMQWPGGAVYTFAAWACWTFNLAVCEVLLRWPDLRARLRGRLSALPG